MTRMSIADGANMRVLEAPGVDPEAEDASLGPALATLPPPGTKRWVIRRKAEVVAAVRGGLLSLEEACSR